MQPGYKTTQLEGITDITLIAGVKPGFVKGAFETEPLVDRLGRVLGVIQAVRQFTREASPQASGFADPVGRFQEIHFFRVGLMAPEPVAALPATGRSRAFLNVTFDGGWEPYMRMIWGPLGSFLDLIFCHCDGYPLSCRSSFAEFKQWVRDHELPSALFYADSGATVADRAYAARLDRLQREHGDAANADAQAAREAVPAAPRAADPTQQAVVAAAFRALKAFAGLRPYFPGEDPQGHDDGGLLLRFVQDQLHELRRWIVAADNASPPDPFLQHLCGLFADEVAWLRRDLTRPAPPTPRLSYSAQQVQAGIAESLNMRGDATCGALVLLRMADAAAARVWLRSFAPTTGGEADAAPLVRTLALTYAGLCQLGLPPAFLAALPREFVEGMEARAGILGDVRGNHPQQWRRPRPNWPAPRAGAPALALSSVHVVVQLRRALKAGEAFDEQQLPLDLRPEIKALQEGSGLQVLSVQAMHSQAAGRLGARNAFGFVDGISQPTLDGGATSPALPERWGDRVGPGELFLGFGNERGDAPVEAPPASAFADVFDLGSFLVVRKLRVFPRRFDLLVEQAVDRLAPADKRERRRLTELFRSQLMGRHSDGRPVVGGGGRGDNAFTYHGPGGAACPFAAHVRRANPRERRPELPEPQRFGFLPPRLARRGMSYGPLSSRGRTDSDQGIVFMAYNASIAEQYEVVQRWLTGGNSSGVASTHDDPFLRVPQAERSSVFRVFDGDRVLRIDLGAEPLVALQWGLYAFVPSIAGLAALADLRTQPLLQSAPPAVAAGSKGDWQRVLEDNKARAPAWAAVRSQPGGVLYTDYGVLVGGQAPVLDVLRDAGSRFSVCGYGTRMETSIGKGHLGLDEPAHSAYGPRVNRAIEASVSEADAYRHTLEAAALALADWKRSGLPGLDFNAFAHDIVARLCTRWTGVPDGRHVKAGPRSEKADELPPLCPGHVNAASRYLFSPWPSSTVKRVASGQGASLLAGVKAFLEAHQHELAAADAPAAVAPDVEPWPMTRRIVAALGPEASNDLRASCVAGALLGFTPTVLGNVVSVLAGANLRGLLGDWQILLAAADPGRYESVAPTLRPRLLATMRAAPIPNVDWRTAACDGMLGGVEFKEGDTIVVGLASAMQEAGADDRLMFGGAPRGSGGANPDIETTHGCPGYAIAVGVMVGILVAVLRAGTLTPTADPRVVSVSA